MVSSLRRCSYVVIVLGSNIFTLHIPSNPYFPFVLVIFGLHSFFSLVIFSKIVPFNYMTSLSRYKISFPRKQNLSFVSSSSIFIFSLSFHLFSVFPHKPLLTRRPEICFLCAYIFSFPLSLIFFFSLASEHWCFESSFRFKHIYILL